MTYTKHGRGAAGVGSTRRFGDFGIEQLRVRDARIIESLKLAKAQETERSQNLISQQKDVDRTELGVEEDIQQLKQDYFQNALAATKLRGRQEGQKGRDLARMIKADAQPMINLFKQLGSDIGNIAAAKLESTIETNKQKQTQEAYDDVDPEDTALKTSIINFQFNKDAQDSENVKHLSSYVANAIQIGTPLMTSAGQAGTAMGLNDKIELLQSQAVTQLIQAGITPNAANVKQYLGLRFKSLGKAYGLIDKNGEWISNKHILNLQRNWNIKANQISLNFNNAEVQRLNEQSRNVTYGELSTELTADNLFKASIVWTFRPQEKDHKSFYTMADGVEQTFMRLAGDKKVLKRDALKLGNQAWIESKPGPNFGKPNAKGQTYFQKFPELEQQFIKERTTWENQWTADTKAAKKEADREDNKNVFAPLLDTWDGRTDLGPIIREMTMKHGKDSLTVTNLKLLQKGSIANYNSDKQEEMLEEAKKNMDHIFLVNMLHSSELTGEARKKWREKYLPLLGPLRKIGFTSEGQSDKHEKQSMRILKYNTVKSGVTPETLEASVVFQDGIFWEKYEEITTGPNAIAAPGSADALSKADQYVTQVMENLEIISSGDRKGNGPAEFAMFLPGGVSWKDSEKYSISQQEYKQRVADLGEAKAALTDGVVSKEHIGYVITQLINGKTFEPIGFTGQIEGLTRQKFYQHHVDKEVKARGWDFKLVVPKDFKSSVKEDKAFDRSLKRHIQSVRTSTGFWKIMTTEAEGTRSQKTVTPTAKAAVNNVITPKTTINESGHETINTNPDLSFEPGSDAPAVLVSASEEHHLNPSELTKVPTYYGDNIAALPGSNFEKYLFNSGQTDFFPVPTDTGIYWRHRI